MIRALLWCDGGSILVSNINSETSSKTILVIRLGACASDPVYWYVKTESGKDCKYGRLNNYTELKDISFYFNDEVKILVTSRVVIFRTIKIKNKKYLKNRRFLLFSIESLIVGDIENYHVVILKSSREFCHVMVFERDFMNLWLGWLTEIGISTTVMIPDVLTLPFLENKWFTVKLDNEWLIRDSGVSGFLLDRCIFEKLYLSTTLPFRENLLIPNESQESTSEVTNFCEALNIMDNNIGNNNANLLSGQYYHHRKVVVNNSLYLMIIFSCILLFVVIYSNSYFYRSNILKDIHDINILLSDFHVKYPLVLNYKNNSAIAGHDYEDIYSDFIDLLHKSSEVLGDADISINSISFDNNAHKISFNIDDDEDVVWELKDPHEQDERLNITKVFNDNDTCEIIFEFK